MKVAILHDYFDDIGGAEILLMQLARNINATIFTTNINKKQIIKTGFGDVKIKSIGRVPNIPKIKQIIAQIRFSMLNKKDFDIYILGGSCSIHSSKKHTPTFWYCFSPQRGLYDLKNVKNKGIKKLLFKYHRAMIPHQEITPETWLQQIL